nr:hypothetical protein [uncultured bacterium]
MKTTPSPGRPVGRLSGRGAREYCSTGRARVARKFSPPVFDLDGSSLILPAAGLRVATTGRATAQP